MIHASEGAPSPSRVDYRRKALLARIHTTIDTFYMRQEIDWSYDVRKILDRILELAMEELEFGEGKRIDRGLIILRGCEGEQLQVGAGWRVGEKDLDFSHTIVAQTLAEGRPILVENARRDPRFENAESVRRLEVLSLVCVPIKSEGGPLGAIYIERRDAGHLFTQADRDFLEEFAATIAPYFKTALLHQEHVAEIRALRAALEQGATMPHIIGRSQALTKVLDLARIAAGVERTVLITGESGSGKELLARAIHAQSRRKDRPFVVVDCSGLSENLLESELFGHRRGSFTGAVTDKAGAFEEADGGTLFLDEISDASKSMQQQLRRVLQEGEIRRVGDSAYRKVDVRVICATNRHLPDEVAAGRFMHDLFHRLHQFPIRMPSLRERKEDIPTLVLHFIAGAGECKNPPVRGIEPAAMQLLVSRDWHSNNVRELRNVVELAVDLAFAERIDLQTLERTLNVRGEPAPAAACAAPASGTARAGVGFAGECLILDSERARGIFAETAPDTPKDARPYYRVQSEFSGKLIVESLRYTAWKLRPAARLLGISPGKLRQDFKQYLELLLGAAGERGGEAVAEMLDMPAETVRRKLSELEIDVETLGKKRSTEGAA